MSPEATVETISLGTPTGRARIAPAGHGRPGGAAEADDAVQLAFGVQPGGDRRGAVGHRRHRPALVAGADQLGVVVATGRRDLRPADLGRNRGLAEDADIDDQGVEAAGGDDVADEGGFGALGVECGDDDGCFGHVVFNPLTPVSPFPPLRQGEGGDGRPTLETAPRDGPSPPQRRGGRG